VRWQDQLRRRRFSATIRKRMALGATLKFAQLRGFVGQNVVARLAARSRASGWRPGQGQDRRRRPDRRRGAPIPAQLQGQGRAWFLVAFGGLRASELRGLTWANPI
jgi:hypothetical protein